MINNKTFLYSVAFLSMTIPVQGRFVYGVILVLELILLELSGTLFRFLAKKLKFNDIASYFSLMLIISITILYRQILAITYSEIVLSMGFIIYFPAVSDFLIHTVFENQESQLSKVLKTNFCKVLIFSIPILIFFLFRDLACYGTFTFFGHNHKMFEKIIMNPDNIGVFMFFASIPGSLILAGALIYLLIFIKNKTLQYSQTKEEQ